MALRGIGAVCLCLQLFVISVGVSKMYGAEGERSDCEDNYVSIIDLISRPEKYDGRSVKMIGYVTIGFENCVIFLSKESADRGITKNGLWLSLPGPLKEYADYDKKYVFLEGTFRKGNAGLTLHSGEIDAITRLEICAENRAVIEWLPKAVFGISLSLLLLGLGLRFRRTTQKK